MIIAALQKKGNDVIVAFDDGTFLSLDYRIVVDNGIWKGQELDEKKIELLSHESSFVKVKDSAFRYLSLRLHSTSELRLKLLRKKYSKEIINEVIDFLTEKKFLDDEEFARQYVSDRLKRKKIGTNKLKMELIKKGINRNSIKNNLQELDDEVLYENALSLARKKQIQIERKETDTRKIASKLYSFLAGKGYEREIIMKVISNLKIQSED